VRRCAGGAGGGAAPAGGGGGLAGRRRRQGRRAGHAAGGCLIGHVLPALCSCTATHLMQAATGNACAAPFQNDPIRCRHHLLVALQGVLGELSYESDAAERLRSEVRAASAEAGRLRAQLDADAARLAAAEQVPRRSFSCTSIGPGVLA
jgi:hypothetical protein